MFSKSHTNFACVLCSSCNYEINTDCDVEVHMQNLTVKTLATPVTVEQEHARCTGHSIRLQ
jgi:hypothetical protein